MPPPPVGPASPKAGGGGTPHNPFELAATVGEIGGSWSGGAMALAPSRTVALGSWELGSWEEGGHGRLGSWKEGSQGRDELMLCEIITGGYDD